MITRCCCCCLLLPLRLLQGLLQRERAAAGHCRPLQQK
jgi:hypothetical protein